MVGSLVLALIVIALVVWGGRRALAHNGPQVSDGASIRRFFTYAALFGLLMVACSGLVGLLARVIDVGRPTEAFDDALAQQTAFAVVGIPLFVVVAAWTRGRIRSDATEARSRGFTLYLDRGVGGLDGVEHRRCPGHRRLGARRALQWRLTVRGASSLGGSWLAHRGIERRVVGRDMLTVAGFLGAAIGLGVAAAGAVMLVGGLLGPVLRIPVSEAADAPSMLQLGVMTLLAGAPVWAVCWAVAVRRLQRGTLWHVQVLLVGVAGGLLTAVVGASVALDRLVVWLLEGSRVAQRRSSRRCPGRSAPWSWAAWSGPTIGPSCASPTTRHARKYAGRTTTCSQGWASSLPP